MSNVPLNSDAFVYNLFVQNPNQQTSMKITNDYLIKYNKEEIIFNVEHTTSKQSPDVITKPHGGKTEEYDSPHYEFQLLSNF